MIKDTKLPRNLGLEIARATEYAAIAGGRWMGLGQSVEADRDAARSMIQVLNTIAIHGDIVVGEERKFTDRAIIASHIHVGLPQELPVDVLADPIDGCSQLANGFPGVISVAAVAPYQTVWRVEGAQYMEKVIVGPELASCLVPECLDAPAAWTLALIARKKGVHVKDITVFILDRPRHKNIINEIRSAGAHVMLRPDGDIGGALLACTPDHGVDLLMGTGGLLEGLIATCAIKALGGAIYGRLNPQSEDEYRSIMEIGLDSSKILSAEDLVMSDHVFFAATGITDGPLLNGVVYRGQRAETDSLIFRGETKTRRRIVAEHLLVNNHTFNE